MRNLAITSPSYVFFYDFPVILLGFPILYGDCVQQPVRGQIMGDATPLRHLAFGPRRVYEPLGDAWRACTAVPEIPVGNKKKIFEGTRQCSRSSMLAHNLLLYIIKISVTCHLHVPSNDINYDINQKNQIKS
jgi:hypothetical protein